MKIAWHRVIITLGIMGLAIYIIVNLFKPVEDNVICKGIDVNLMNECKLVTVEDIKDIITASGITGVGKPLDDSATKKVRELLNTKSYIKNVTAYQTSDKILHIELEQRMPVVRIVTNTGSCYLDNEGYAFPPSLRYSYDVPLITGNMPLPRKLPYNGPLMCEFVQNLLDFSNFIKQNPFWNAQIQQVEIDNSGDVVFVVCSDNNLVRLGQLDNFETKMKNLYTFYKKVVPYRGAYKVLDLRFDKQIVALEDN